MRCLATAASLALSAPQPPALAEQMPVAPRTEPASAGGPGDAAGAEGPPAAVEAAVEAAVTKAAAMARAGDPLAAARHLEALLAARRLPRPVRGRLLVLVGDHLERARAYQAAYRHWQAVHAEFGETPPGPRAAYHAAVVGEEFLGRREAARPVYRHLVTSHPETPYALRALHRLALLRPAGAARIAYLEAVYRQARTTPLGPQVLYRCAREAAAAGLMPALLRCARRLARDHRDSPLAGKALLLAADRAAAEGRFETSARICQSLLLDPPRGTRRDEALLQLARIRAAEGQWDGVVSLTRRLVADHPTSRLVDDALFLMARAHYEAGHPAAAQAAYRRLLRLRPHSRYAKAARAALP